MRLDLLAWYTHTHADCSQLGAHRDDAAVLHAADGPRLLSHGLQVGGAEVQPGPGYPQLSRLH